MFIKNIKAGSLIGERTERLYKGGDYAASVEKKRVSWAVRQEKEVY